MKLDLVCMGEGKKAGCWTRISFDSKLAGRR